MINCCDVSSHITPHFNPLLCETNKIILLYLLYLHTVCVQQNIIFLTDFYACILKARKAHVNMMVCGLILYLFRVLSFWVTLSSSWSPLRSLNSSWKRLSCRHCSSSMVFRSPFASLAEFKMAPDEGFRDSFAK